MNSMLNAKIKFSMLIRQDDDHLEIKYTADANFVKKNKTFFLFFNEINEDNQAVTKCRFEISANSIRLRRNGPIVIEQQHQLDQITKGYIKTPFGRLDTTLKTSQLVFTYQADGNYRLKLTYDLFTGGEKTGNYVLDMIIELTE